MYQRDTTAIQKDMHRTRTPYTLSCVLHDKLYRVNFIVCSRDKNYLVFYTISPKQVVICDSNSLSIPQFFLP